MRALRDVVLAVLLLLPNVKSQDCSMDNPCASLAGAENQQLVFPTVYESEGGSLEVPMVIEPVELTYDWLTWTTRGVNGAIPGPTILIKPGDNLKITVTNDLDPNPDDMLPDEPDFRLQNSYNLHTHGLHVSSIAPADDVLSIHIHPRHKYEYEYEILETQTPGAFWYHPHFKGPSTLQVNGGLTGAIIVMDDPALMPAELRAFSLPRKPKRDMVLVLQHVLDWMDTGLHQKGHIQQQIKDQYEFTDRGLKDFLEDPDNGINYYTVNGQLKPTTKIRNGRAYRLRLIHAAGFLPLEVELPGCDMWLLAMDGVYLPRPELRTYVAVSSASRADVAIRCTSRGTAELRSTPVEDDDHSWGGDHMLHYDDVLMTFDVRGSETEGSSWPGAVATMDLTPLRPDGVYPDLTTIDRDCDAAVREVGPDCIWGRYTMEFGTKALFNRELLYDTMSDMIEEITVPDEGTYVDVVPSTAPKRVHYRMPRDAVVEFTVFNTERDHTHNLHVHINHFQVVSYEAYDGAAVWRDPEINNYVEFTNLNGDTCEVQYDSSYSGSNRFSDPSTTPNRGAVDMSYANHELEHHTTEGQRGPYDAVDAGGYIPYGQWRDTINVPPLSKIKFRYYAHDLLGLVLCHCHVATHSDNGMAMIMEVVEHNECARPDANSNEFMAGTCMEDDTYPSTGWGLDPEAGPEPECENGVYKPPSKCGGTEADPCSQCVDDYCPFAEGYDAWKALDCVRSLPEEWVEETCLDALVV